MKNSLSVMLVDDNEIDLFLHEKFIARELFAHEIIKCTSAEGALSYLTFKDPIHWPDVILLDIQMPVSDGFDFINKYEKLIDSNSKKCSIIMISSSLNFGDLSRARANRLVIDILKKPLNTTELISVLKSNDIL